jgi:hypothetical protein
MGARRDLGLAEPAHLGPDRLERLVETGVANRAETGGGADQPDEPGAVLRRVAARD